jgi:hypothetical protein
MPYPQCYAYSSSRALHQTSKAATFVQNELDRAGISSIPLHITTDYFF